jgi:Tol biopolymer transport system component
VQQLTHDRLTGNVACSPDAKWVYFQNSEAPFAIERVPMEGGTPEMITASVVPDSLGTLGPSISPDGRLLTFTVTRVDPRKTQIALVNLDGSAGEPARKFLDADPRMSGHAEFTPDGKGVVYAVAENGVENLWLQPLSGAPGRKITNFTTDVFTRFQYSPKGKTLAALRFHKDSDVVLLHDASPSN